MAFSFLDILFPKKCVSCGNLGSYICKNCFSKVEFVDMQICPVCRTLSESGKTHKECFEDLRLDGLFVACKYRGPLKKAIVKIKYKFIYDIEKILADLIVRRFEELDLPKNTLFVPVPLHDLRKRWRGFNQSEILAQILAKSFNFECADILVRNRETKPQVGMDIKQRKENMEAAFSLKKGSPSIYKNRNILLVDDVFTSGVTIGERCKLLKQNGAEKVVALVVALG